MHAVMNEKSLVDVYIIVSHKKGHVRGSIGVWRELLYGAIYTYYVAQRHTARG
jgi:hypothetical protein